MLWLSLYLRWVLIGLTRPGRHAGGVGRGIRNNPFGRAHGTGIPVRELLASLRAEREAMA